MDKFDETLRLLTKKDEVQSDFNETLSRKVKIALEHLNVDSSATNTLLEDLGNPQDNNVRWQYISVSFYVLLSLKEDESTISVARLNGIRIVCQFIISLGLLPNLMPGVGVDLNQRCKNVDKIPKEESTVPEQYYRLRGTVKGLLLCLNVPTFKHIIMLYFNDILSALCQLCYAPIKKPSPNKACGSEFIMTEQFYNELVIDRSLFEEHLGNLLSNTYAPKVMQELMLIYGRKNSPRWLKSAVFKLLLSKLQSNEGVLSLVRAMTDAESLDTGAGWKQCDIVVKILMTKPGNLTDHAYYNNICSQVLSLTSKFDQNARRIPIYERIVTMCVRYLYAVNVNVCERYFLDELMQTLLNYTRNPTSVVGVITNDVTCNVSLFYHCFIQTSASTRILPISLIDPVVLILAHIYSIILGKFQFKETADQIKHLLVKYLDLADEKQRYIVFESFLFHKLDKDNFQFIVNNDCDLEFKNVTENVSLNSLMNCDCLLDMVRTENGENISISLCIYLFEISIQTSNSSECTERKIVVYHLLSSLLTNEKVHSHLKRDPVKITSFITNTLKTLVTNKIHLRVDSESEQFQTLFLLAMILSVIHEKLDEHSVKDFETLKNTLHIVVNDSSNSELKSLIRDIPFMSETRNPQDSSTNEKSEYDRAIEEVCDPLLPVRGHGLLTLAKLIKNKDPIASEKKLYILNICQQHVKCDDSYVYLSAISVLSALGDSFPELVLSTLADEYANGSKDVFANDHETRIKLGEVLLRVVQAADASEAVVKYKSLLLNTFLSCVRDEDHWIRASSLSNLGELCRVLGYKLGSVVSEVLSCIHAVIATDKAVESRRAAVSVIRMLFVGLESETIVFLKDDILPIYRTLKTIYTSDPDDITRLQAQLALEQLNENMRDFVSPRAALAKNRAALR